MTEDYRNKEGLPGIDPGRREFLKKSGTALAAGVALSSISSLADSLNEDAPQEDRISPLGWNRPNLLIIITDQERHPQHWPDGWAEQNLPNRKRLADKGLTFKHAFCASSMCTPSRATLFTGLYPSEHMVEETLRYGDTPEATTQHTLSPETQNLGKMLTSAGYDVQYRGKWHISKDPSGTTELQSRKQLETYGFYGWQPPEGGQDQDPAHFGGGNVDYDGEYAAQAAAFLRNFQQGASRPFALFVCLINPHDLMAYPGVSPMQWNSTSFSDIPPYKGGDNYGYLDFNDAPLNRIDLPETFSEPSDNFKPHAQAESTLMWADDRMLGALVTEEECRNYVRFYAHLHQVSDKHIGTILDALESRPQIHRNTLVIRTADHGEMGLAHGGMRQKAYSAYEETIHVPFVVSNPILFSRPMETAAMISLVDIMPTLASIAGVPDRESLTFRGRDLSPVIQDAVHHPDLPTRSVQDSVLFTTDEGLGSLLKEPDNPEEPMVKEPSHIRCLREERWKITLYFDPTGAESPQYELYDLATDPLELHNMAIPENTPYYDPARLAEMQDKLRRRMEETRTTPPSLR